MVAGLDVLQGSRGMAVTISWFLLLVLAGLASNLLVCEIHAKEYIVGGELEWTFPPAAQSTWYSDVWARPINFKVGDVLVFTYARLHNVCELGNETDYFACAPNPLALWNSGSTRVTLSKAGAYYFICGSLGHCDLGMKLKVTVESDAVIPSPSPAAASPAPASSHVPTAAPVQQLAPAPTPHVFNTPAPVQAPTSTSAATNSGSPERSPPPISSSSPSADATAHQSVTIMLTLFASSLLLYSCSQYAAAAKS
ncbi:unnamed protein product [Sphagnum compactum]